MELGYESHVVRMRKISRAGLIKKLDQAFSRSIRQHHADFGGWVECVTCQKRMPWEDSQAGHFIKRGHAATRWDERNVAPQCARCNLYLNGAQDEFAAYIVRRFGQPALEELIRLKHTEKRWRIPELKELLEQYQ
jgi:hypothetical protein